MKNNKPATFFFTLCLAFLTTLGSAEVKNTLTMTVETQNGNLLITAHDVRLGDLLDKVSEVCKIDIRGLENRADETVSFVSGNEPVEWELRRLFRQLNVQNYTFEYGEDHLRIVSVFPRSKSKELSTPLFPDNENETGKRQTRAVRIVRIIEGSQAEILNLMEGDLVISYDNTRITGAGQLVRLVKSKQDWERLEMTVVRDGVPIRLIVNGGQIGIHIKTEQVSSEILEQYYSQ